MKYLRKTLLGLGIVLLAAAVLLWFLPARWAQPLLTPRLHGLQLQQVQGLLWQGSAGRVLAADGRVLGRVQWQLSRRALLGEMRLQLDFEGPQLDFSGHVQRQPDDRIELRQMRAHAALAASGQRLASPLGEPRGELELEVGHAVLQGGWPLQLQATARWQHAAMHTSTGDVALGDWQLQMQARDGVIEAQFQDDGHGPLRGEGQLQLSVLGWRLEASLQPAPPNPALYRWLLRLGTPAADGTVHVQRRGGLGS